MPGSFKKSADESPRFFRFQGPVASLLVVVVVMVVIVAMIVAVIVIMMMAVVMVMLVQMVVAVRVVVVVVLVRVVVGMVVRMAVMAVGVAVLVIMRMAVGMVVVVVTLELFEAGLLLGTAAAFGAHGLLLVVGARPCLSALPAGCKDSSRLQRLRHRHPARSCLHFRVRAARACG